MKYYKTNRPTVLSSGLTSSYLRPFAFSRCWDGTCATSSTSWTTCTSTSASPSPKCSRPASAWRRSARPASRCTTAAPARASRSLSKVNRKHSTLHQYVSPLARAAVTTPVWLTSSPAFEGVSSYFFEVKWLYSTSGEQDDINNQ